MNDPGQLRFDGCVATNLEEAYRHLEHVYERLIAPLGVSVLEWYALRALYAEDGATASQLAQAVCRHPSSMTALLDRMEEKGLVTRKTDTHDRRTVRVFLTEAGRGLQPHVEAAVDQLNALINERITAEQLDTFLYVLGVLQSFEMPDDPLPSPDDAS